VNLGRDAQLCELVREAGRRRHEGLERIRVVASPHPTAVAGIATAGVVAGGRREGQGGVNVDTQRFGWGRFLSGASLAKLSVNVVEECSVEVLELGRADLFIEERHVGTGHVAGRESIVGRGGAAAVTRSQGALGWKSKLYLCLVQNCERAVALCSWLGRCGCHRKSRRGWLHLPRDWPLYPAHSLFRLSPEKKNAAFLRHDFRVGCRLGELNMRCEALLIFTTHRPSPRQGLHSCAPRPEPNLKRDQSERQVALLLQSGSPFSFSPVSSLCQSAPPGNHGLCIYAHGLFIRLVFVDKE